MIKTISIGLLLSIAVSSCSQNRTYLTEEEKGWNPYKKGQILVFESSGARSDSIFIKKVTDGLFPDGIGVVYYNESLYASGLHPDIEYDRYLQNPIIMINAYTSETPTQIEFKLTVREARFWGKNYSIEQIAKLPEMELQTEFDYYNDVIVIVDNFNPKRKEKAIEIIYWSKSKGYVRFDKYDGTTWELIEIIEPEEKP